MVAARSWPHGGRGPPVRPDGPAQPSSRTATAGRDRVPHRSWYWHRKPYAPGRAGGAGLKLARSRRETAVRRRWTVPASAFSPVVPGSDRLPVPAPGPSPQLGRRVRTRRSTCPVVACTRLVVPLGLIRWPAPGEQRCHPAPTRRRRRDGDLAARPRRGICGTRCEHPPPQRPADPRPASRLDRRATGSSVPRRCRCLRGDSDWTAGAGTPISARPSDRARRPHGRPRGGWEPRASAGRPPRDGRRCAPR
jgi:hypothetical protein